MDNLTHDQMQNALHLKDMITYYGGNKAKAKKDFLTRRSLEEWCDANNVLQSFKTVQSEKLSEFCVPGRVYTEWRGKTKVSTGHVLGRLAFCWVYFYPKNSEVTYYEKS